MKSARPGLLGHLDKIKRKLEQIRDVAERQDNGLGSIESYANTALHAVNNALTIAEGEEREGAS